MEIDKNDIYYSYISEIIKYIKNNKYITINIIKSMFPVILTIDALIIIKKMLDKNIIKEIKGAFVCPYCKKFMTIIDIWNIGDDIECSQCKNTYYISESDRTTIYIPVEKEITC